MKAPFFATLSALLFGLSCQSAPAARPTPLSEPSPIIVEPLDAGSVPAPTAIVEPPDAGPLLPPATAFQPTCEMAWSPECFRSVPRTETCPAKHAEIEAGALCGVSGQTAPLDCRYPEGRCRCLHQPYCGGVPPTPLQQVAMSWECGPPASPEDCPDDVPASGAKCRPAGKTCNYGGCGTSTSCHCLKGKWQCAQHYWAPPP